MAKTNTKLDFAFVLPYNTKMNKGLIVTKNFYNLDYYSVGCSARSLRSNHVPQLVVDDFTSINIVPANDLGRVAPASEVAGGHAMNCFKIGRLWV
jgi:hypothetical protein